MTIRGLMWLVFWVALFFAVNAWMAPPRPIRPGADREGRVTVRTPPGPTRAVNGRLPDPGGLP